MDDKHILARARRGELDAFEELVRQYEKRVYAVALRSSGSPEDAADITQEVFLRAWRSIESFRGDSGFSTWLFRITMNLCVDHARHKNAQPQTQPLVVGEEDAERPIPDTAPTPEEHLENSELGRELAAALDEVSEEHRRIVLLRDVQRCLKSAKARSNRGCRARVLRCAQFCCGEGTFCRPPRLKIRKEAGTHE